MRARRWRFTIQRILSRPILQCKKSRFTLILCLVCITTICIFIILENFIFILYFNPSTELNSLEVKTKPDQVESLNDAKVAYHPGLVTILINHLVRQNVLGGVTSQPVRSALSQPIARERNINTSIAEQPINSDILDKVLKFSKSDNVNIKGSQRDTLLQNLSNVQSHENSSSNGKDFPMNNETLSSIKEFHPNVTTVRTKQNIFNYKIILKPSHLCSTKQYMIILIHSFHTRAERRQAIRSTWASPVLQNASWPAGIGRITESIRLVFILGLHTDPSLNDLAREESEKYGDIVVGNFMDSYRNMTLKSLLGLKLVMEHCAGVEYLLKSDDDMFINLPYLLYVLNLRQPSRSIMGPYSEGAKVRRTGKWGLTREEYSPNTLPPYEAGSAYVITGDIVKDLYLTAEYVRWIHIDDVYITGIVAGMINVTHVRQPGFAFAPSRPPETCDIVLRRILAGTKATPEVLNKIWSELQQENIMQTCAKEAEKKS